MTNLERIEKKQKERKELKENAEKFKTIVELVKKHPNDYDLGLHVRQEINKHKN